MDLGSDQTSLHNPWSGGYYPAGLSFEESNMMMSEDPEKFKEAVRSSLKKTGEAINRHSEKGTYFFDYGNAFLLEASRAGADVLKSNGEFRYPSYVQDIMGPMCFDYGFGPFRWVCCSNEPADLEVTDRIAIETLEKLIKKSPDQIKQQMDDNITGLKRQEKTSWWWVRRRGFFMLMPKEEWKLPQHLIMPYQKAGFPHLLLLDEIITMCQAPIRHTGRHQISMTVQNLLPIWLFRM